MTSRLVYSLITLQCIGLALFTTQISISGQEALTFFYHTDIAGKLSYYTTKLFGQNDLVARAPFLALHLLSTAILFELSKTILSRDFDRIVAISFYMMLPGINIAALLINKAQIIIFLTLLLLLCMHKKMTLPTYLLLILYSLIDNAFAILFLSLIFYGIKLNDKKIIFLNILLFGINMFLFGFDDGGRPKSLFLDTLGVYFAIFSPLVFAYFLFSLYKTFKNGSSQAISYISFWALIFSLIISIRQKIRFEDFAPFVVISVLFMVSTFFASYRVRLRPFRRSYKALGYTLFTTLALTLSLIYCSKYIYPFLSAPTKHFAYDYHIAKELAIELKKLDIDSIKCDNKELQLRLKFYGISENKAIKLTKMPRDNSQKVSIIYTGVVVATFYVTKVNTF